MNNSNSKNVSKENQPYLAEIEGLLNGVSTILKSDKISISRLFSIVDGSEDNIVRDILNNVNDKAQVQDSQAIQC